MSENKTKPTSVSVEDFLKTVSEQRQHEAYSLIELMGRITGEPAVMWGPSIIGFGLQHYKTDAGSEGDMGLLGFSPRKASLTVYFNEGFDRYGEELKKLGKHTVSRACLYIKKLTDIDMRVLESMLRASYELAVGGGGDAPSDVSSYVAAIPEPAKSQFSALRAIVRSEAPGDDEVFSYGIIGYKPDPKKRASVFISGWKDHVSIYPVPKDDDLRAELAPYIHGKGTLWFDLKSPLPEDLIRRSVRALREAARG